MLSPFSLIYVLLIIKSFHYKVEAASTDLLLFTVATDNNDGYQRFLRSADFYGYNVTVLGRNTQWQGGDIIRLPGGGQKVNLLRDALRDLRHQTSNSLLIMFVDSYDVVLTATPTEVITAFKRFHVNVVFSAEAFCWPDGSLASLYPSVKVNEKRYLNSGGFIGYLPQISELLVRTIKNNDDDQLYFTKQFLDEEKRANLKMKLDTRSVIFQNLNGALDEVDIKFRGNMSYLYNRRTGNIPIVVHGNGPIKIIFNSLTNYLVNGWVARHGCLACKEQTHSLANTKEEHFPSVFVAVFIEYPTLFLEDCLERIVELAYPKNKIDMFIYYAPLHSVHTLLVCSIFKHTSEDKASEGHVMKFARSHVQSYHSIRIRSPNSGLDEKQARNLALQLCEQTKCDYYFTINADVQLENVRTLQLLIGQNRSVIAPMVNRPGRVWSNFWGAISSDGFYQRSADYMEIVDRRRLGLWNVPYIGNVYLIQGKLISHVQNFYSDDRLDSDMAFCEKMRGKLYFMYVDNQFAYGHLTDSSNYDTSHLHSDLYAFFDNRYTWEKKYIDPAYYRILEGHSFQDIDQPCPDVFTVPLLKPVFCQHLIEELRHFISDGRLRVDYEDSPSFEFHLAHVGLEKHWFQILREFIAPTVPILYPGYYTEAKPIMNYVARYQPSSESGYTEAYTGVYTFAVNIALNEAGIDFQGGGTRFTRYNCSVTKNRVGWTLVYPGRITHKFDRFPVASGIQYMMVTFVD